MSSPNKNYEIVLSDKVLSMSEKHYFLKFPESSQEDICVRNQCLETLLKHLLPRRVFPEKYSSKQLFLKRTYQCLWVIFSLYFCSAYLFFPKLILFTGLFTILFIISPFSACVLLVQMNGGFYFNFVFPKIRYWISFFTLSLKQEISDNNIIQKDIKDRSRNPVILEMELFAIIVNGFQPL